MADYQQVQDALASGVEPSLICSTCPWDRFCITPPELTKDQIERQLEKAKQTDEETVARAKEEGKEVTLGTGIMSTLFTSLFLSGRETAAQACPVLIARMRSSDGRNIVDNIKSQMQSWNDDAVSIF